MEWAEEIRNTKSKEEEGVGKLNTSRWNSPSPAECRGVHIKLPLVTFLQGQVRYSFLS